LSSSSSASTAAGLANKLLLLAKTLGCPDAGAPNKDPVGALKRPVPAELPNKLFEGAAGGLLPNKLPLGYILIPEPKRPPLFWADPKIEFGAPKTESDFFSAPKRDPPPNNEPAAGLSPVCLSKFAPNRP